MNAIKGVAAVLCLAALAGCDDDEDAIETFTATLNGAQEVPAVTTTATGSATITLSEGEDVSYIVTVAGISGNPTMAHIHVGATGAEGVPVYTFTHAAVTTGTVASGDLNPANLTITMDSLIVLLRNGNAYVNVHTAANPDGEIRGQIN